MPGAADTLYCTSVPTCPFCSANSEDAWIMDERAVALPKLEPIAPGHALVAARRHVACFYDLDVVEQRAVWNMVAAVKQRIAEGLKVARFEVGFADFDSGDGHAHIHVIPRGVDEDFELPGGIEWVKE